MSLALAAALVLSAAPQGVSIRLAALSAPAEARAEVNAVTQALTSELTAEGYAVVAAADTRTRPKAELTGSLTTRDGGYFLVLTLVRTADGQVVEELKTLVRSAKELPGAATEAAKKLGAEIRLTWGVRAKIKL